MLLRLSFFPSGTAGSKTGSTLCKVVGALTKDGLLTYLLRSTNRPNMRSSRYELMVRVAVDYGLLFLSLATTGSLTQTSPARQKNALVLLKPFELDRGI
jgi:hypothetical protein